MVQSSILVLSVAFLSLFSKSVTAIDCYQCAGTDSENPFQCNEFLDSDVDLLPQPCDKIYGARFCIKHVGRFEVLSIKCYQCNSTSTLECADIFIDQYDSTIEPKSCSHVYNSKYCIKSFAMNGGIGTVRYCSPFDLGNYCNYVRQPGDILEYRSCVYTCGTDGCNAATTGKAPVSLFALSLSLISYLYFFRSK